MSTPFKEQLAIDIEEVWFNNDEFCDFHLIDGNKMHVLFDKYELEKNDRSDTKASLGKNSDGLYVDNLLIYVPCSEFGAKPRTGRILNVDGKKNYKIIDVLTEDGVFAMQLEAFKG